MDFAVGDFGDGDFPRRGPMPFSAVDAGCAWFGDGTLATREASKVCRCRLTFAVTYFHS